MSKLVDIKGYWNVGDIQAFNEISMWEGKLLLEDDGWFEGIANDSVSSAYTGDTMIFGIYHPFKVIELIRIAPANVGNPYVFCGRREAKGYEGYFSNLKRGFPSGVTHMITQDVDYLKENNYPEVAGRDVEKEKEELNKRIANFKQHDDFKELYETFKEIKSGLSKYVLRKYNVETIAEKVDELLIPVQEEIEGYAQKTFKN